MPEDHQDSVKAQEAARAEEAARQEREMQRRYEDGRKDYILMPGKSFSGIVNGQRKEFQPGEAVPLHEDQYEAFKDRFVKNKGEFDGLQEKAAEAQNLEDQAREAREAASAATEGDNTPPRAPGNVHQGPTAAEPFKPADGVTPTPAAPNAAPVAPQATLTTPTAGGTQPPAPSGAPPGGPPPTAGPPSGNAPPSGGQS